MHCEQPADSLYEQQGDENFFVMLVLHPSLGLISYSHRLEPVTNNDSICSTTMCNSPCPLLCTAQLSAPTDYEIVNEGTTVA